tara:strand:- start:268 stop:1185 length:918 start_codon:yes stop_codon:yes gene_type:complete
MKKWVLKALIQKFISFLPGSHRINFWFQKYITKGVHLSDSYFSDKLMHAEDHLRFYSKNHSLTGIRTLELGTGWYPVVPISLYLAGAESVSTIDLSRLMNQEALVATVQKFQAWIKADKLKPFKEFWREDRLQQLMILEADKLDFESLLLAFNLDYRVGDARHLTDADASFDLIHSNNVFEHIYPQILKEILVEFKRVLKPQGLMSHFIDMSDHFAHLDSSINIYNFLRFSESTWQTIDNSVQPQNRLRLSDYEAMYADLNLPILDKKVRPGEPDKLEGMKLAAPYKGRSTEDLAISHAHLINSL